MKTKLALGILTIATVFFVMGRATAQQSEHASLHPETLKNLMTAMHGEAFAYVKYTLYADHARKEGNTEIADLFSGTAKTERFEHFAEEAEMAGLVGSDEENLKEAIKGESYEVDTMYREFAEQAKAAGDAAAAKRFEEIRHDEMGHRDAFQAALDKLAPPTGSSY
ncbi:MAG TPA: rubrerythrin family protein [Candidatus Dormibacteraeota bacterium]|nr:rubrerythrin family protein [Candidatus Dormibacteraeota bacterium]